MQTFITILGVWVTANRFIDEYSIEYHVVPYKYIYENYRGQWPLKCYVTLENNRRIIGVCPLNNIR